ncbi:MAG: zinc ribbon domain-containing protein [Thermoplasmata archaeon]
MAEESLPVFVFGCLSCGKTVAGTEKRCPRCGASFEDVKFECPFCGELTSPNQRKCGSCGTEFRAFAEGVCETSLIELDGSEEGPSESAESVSESVEYECPVCGKSISESDSKCPHCGAWFA